MKEHNSTLGGMIVNQSSLSRSQVKGTKGGETEGPPIYIERVGRKNITGLGRFAN